MTLFWILAAALMLLAVIFVAAPLLGARDTDAGDADVDQARVNLDLFKQQVAELDADLATGKLERTQYERARRDLERELLRDTAGLGAHDSKPTADVKLPGPRLTAVALLCAVPLTALALYLILGERQIIPQLELAAAGNGAGAGQHAAGPDGMPSLDLLVKRLEERLQQTPEDAQGWTMLGRTYFATGRTQEAERALARAHELLPDDVQVSLAYAESIAANNDSDLEGRPAALISAALAVEPDNATARWLSGMVAFQRGQFQSAATAWKRVLARLDPASEDAAELQLLIQQAEQRAGIPPEMRLVANNGAPAGAPAKATPAPQPSAAGETPAAGAASGPQPAATRPQPPGVAEAPASSAASQPQAGADAWLDVSVSVAPELAGRMPPETAVFVFARAASGPPMPLAVQRLTLADLPTSVRLDDSMAMMPQLRLSAFPRVVVGVRVSPSGQAMPQPGDLEGSTGPVASTGGGTTSVIIDRVRQ